ncbi:hypothetical protein AMQ83_29725, partial [Paenibacillus riograndensis]
MKNFFKALSVTVLALSLTACGSANNKADTGNDSNASKDEGTLSFAFLPNTQNNKFHTARTNKYKNLAK